MTMTKEQAQAIEQRHNVYIDVERNMFNVGGGYDAEYGWMPIPEEWKTYNKYVVFWHSSRNAGGIEFAGECGSANSEYPEGTLLFDSIEEAQAYIAENEPALTTNNIKPASNFFDDDRIEDLLLC